MAFVQGLAQNILQIKINCNKLRQTINKGALSCDNFAPGTGTAGNI